MISTPPAALDADIHAALDLERLPSAPFGRAWRAEWGLDPGAVYLNHGTVGAPPRRVLAAQRAIQEAIERHPARYLLRELTAVGSRPATPGPSRMRVAAEAVARFVGARGEDLVFVDNVTAGANAVVAALGLAPGDEILVTNHGYGGVTNAARFWARRSGARVETVELPFPPSSPASVVDAVVAAIGPRTRLVVVDQISSDTALLLPAAQIAARCRAAGVAILVDGAHAPGAVALDLPAIGADWYVANLHKWAWSPRASGFLWVAPERRAATHPTIASWGLDQGLTAEFDLPGTRDPSPHLAAPAALALLEAVGGAGGEAVMQSNRTRAAEFAGELCRLWGTSPRIPPEMHAAMHLVPLPEALGGNVSDALALRDRLLFEDGIEIHVAARAGRLWARLAVQIYVDPDEVARFGEVVRRRTRRA